MTRDVLPSTWHKMNRDIHVANNYFSRALAAPNKILVHLVLLFELPISRAVLDSHLPERVSVISGDANSFES